ncbi:hypothetical protein [Corallococcus soli]|uniref:hypothetical protein n=1 Tax=Corallococcus soli TaxID=2710757 RepID=UPI00187557EF|nr:hypothetical protein [Corallococcus soli]
MARLAARQSAVQRVLGTVGGGLFLGGASFGLLGAFTTDWLFIPAGTLAIGSGVLFLIRSAMGAAGGAGANVNAAARIGAGAEIASSARIEPGAVIEMGATVQEEAVIESNTVIRMGATVQRGATVQQGAVVGWGATIQEGATVERGASVGAGATVGRNARLAAGGHLGAGGHLASNQASGASAKRVPDAVAVFQEDARLRELDEVCDRLEAAYRKATPAVREFVSGGEESVLALRRSCHALREREQGLRREVSPDLLARLDAERAALAARINASEDPQVCASLRSAVAAIDAQRGQRERLARNADRLEAELTRLRWSIEGLVAQLVQVNGQSGGGVAPDAELGLGRVQEELAAISDALESVNEAERTGLQPVQESFSSQDSQAQGVMPSRVRG